MTADDPSHRQSGKGLLGWLRRSPHGDDGGADTSGPGHIALADPHRLARAQLLSDVTDFLLTHDLKISGFTLAVAHDYLTGANGRMMRLIDQRIQGREPLSVEWLEQNSHDAGDDERDVLNRMMNRLETNIDAFDRTSSAAKTAASDYSEALTAHVGDLDRPVDAASNDAQTPPSADTHVVQELLTLARTMVERTANLEQDMARSLLETRALRRSLEQARRSAEEDHLTGLPNRRAFEHRFTTEFAAAREAKEQLAVAFCDIDNFKRVNDEHGHEAGDRVLKSVASSLAHISDDRCHVARHGGEEFVVLLRGRSLHQAWELLDDARSAMAERRMVNRSTDTPYGKVTFSGGIADVFAFPDPRTALRAADRALYRAKSEGRNRILVANPASDLAGWPPRGKP
jgi:diguanylate cyclase